MKKAISLFSGAGGDSLGLERSGYQVVAFSEQNKDAIATHQVQFPHSVLLQHEKVTNIQQLPDSVFSTYRGQIDLIFAGFPCQGFSHAGKKKEDDPRNELVHEFVRATRLIQPEWIIGENVKGLLSSTGMDPVTQKQTPVIEIIQRLFQTIGYQIAWNVLDSCEYGVPQRRKRLIIIGKRGPSKIEWKKPPTCAPCSIRSILEPTLFNAIHSAPFDPNMVPEDDARYWIDSHEKNASGKPHPNLVRLMGGIRSLDPEERNDRPEEKSVTEMYPLISYGRRVSSYHGELVDPDTPSKTIICTYQSCPRLFVGINTGSSRWLRTFTITELAQLQGFPIHYPFQGTIPKIIQQIGNAVPPALIEAVVKSLSTIVFL